MPVFFLFFDNLLPLVNFASGLFKSLNMDCYTNFNRVGL